MEMFAISMVALLVYGRYMSMSDVLANAELLGIATVSAMIGAIAGRQIMEKMTMVSVRYVVAVALITLSLAWIAGIV